MLSLNLVSIPKLSVTKYSEAMHCGFILLNLLDYPLLARKQLSPLEAGQSWMMFSEVTTCLTALVFLLGDKVFAQINTEGVYGRNTEGVTGE